MPCTSHSAPRLVRNKEASWSLHETSLMCVAPVMTRDSSFLMVWFYRQIHHGSSSYGHAYGYARPCPRTHAPPATPLYRCFRLVSLLVRTISALRAERHTLTCQWNLVFRMSRGSLFARLPLYCSAECATPTNSSLFTNFTRKLANAPPPPVPS